MDAKPMVSKKEKPVACMSAFDASEGSDLGYKCYRIIDGTKPAIIFDKFSDTIDKVIAENPGEYGADDVFNAFAKDMKGRVVTMPKNGVQIRQFDM